MNVLVVKKPIKYYERYSGTDKKTIDFINKFPEKEKIARISRDKQNETYSVIIDSLENVGHKYDVVERKDLTQIMDYDLIVVEGGDGTVLTTAHHNKNVPILGVNNDEENSVGFYCAANLNNFQYFLENVEAIPKTEVNRLEMVLNGRKIVSALNDAYISLERQHGICNYKIETKEYSKEYKNSGLLMATFTGRFARMKKVIGSVIKTNKDNIQYTPIEDEEKTYGFSYHIKITSMRDNNLISIDGCHNSFSFNRNDVLEVRLGEPLKFIGDLTSKFN